MRYSEWNIGGFDRDAAVRFCRVGINPLVAVFLAARGIGSIDGARALMGGGADAICDPFRLADMDKAVSRIYAAIDGGEHIAVYGDYDVDGMTSCAIMSLWLGSKGADFEIYIPSRLGEGYGLNCPALKTLKSRGAGLVITVDCGATAIAEARYARELGLGLVITDHHECKDELPVADAVVDPKRHDCPYPNKALAGVGVTFKLVCALEGDCLSDEMFRKYGDLVAIGTIADVMPLLGENREMIRRGLRVLNYAPRVGLRSLMSEHYIDGKRINTATVGFVLAPRLNAAGRMGRTELSVKLLLTSDEAEAERLTAELMHLTSERRRIETEMFGEAESMMPETAPDGPIVLARRHWFQGVTGIVAAKMAERYLVPAIIISIDDEGVGHGSCRSIGSFGIHGALRSCEELLVNYGGHDMASGLTIAEGNVDEFRRRINQYYHERVGAARIPGFCLDFEVEKPELLTIRNVEALADLEPFGSGNPPPCLCIREAALSSVFSIGDGKHTRFKIEKSGRMFDCIFFAMPTEEFGFSEDMTVDVAFEPQINEFRGRSSVQLMVFDVRESKDYGRDY